MGLVDLKTDLKSLKFGRDRFDGGDSGQPYIDQPILENPADLHQDKDFILRGGLKAPSDALTDVKRLTKWMFDLKNPAGLLFIAKQNLLSRTAVRTQASGVGVNEGVYTPLSTLGQAAGGFAGLHLSKQGLGVGIKVYGPKSSNNPLSNSVVESVISPETNRLVALQNLILENISENNWNFSGTNLNVGNSIISYGGGPNSQLGIGKTQIRYATSNSGAPLRTGIHNKYAFYRNYEIDAIYPYKNFKSNNISDFRKDYLKDEKSSIIMGIAPDYANKLKTIEGDSTSRIKMRSPGQRGDIMNYTDGKKGSGGHIGAVDKMNFLPIYQSSKGPDNKKDINDLISFWIAAINNKNPKIKEYIHFRAFIDSFNDSYTATWNEERFMGRGESFYKYGGFGRTINLSFTVAAQSKEELIPMYKKLNYLASNLTPTYSSKGFMGGPLVTLTLGGWLYEQPGFITSLTLEVPQESPWEIALDTNGGTDQKVKELPHIVRVSGFSFTPIHNFRPEKQVITPDGNKGGSTDTNSYGAQRYIALEDGETENYNNTFIKGKDQKGKTIFSSKEQLEQIRSKTYFI